MTAVACRRHLPGIQSAVAALAVLVLGCSLATGAQPVAQAATATTHPLSGKIWDVRERRFITSTALLAKLAMTDFVLLGEVHDNPEHHALQAAVLTSLVEAGRRPALVMEQFDRENQAAIDAAVATGADADVIAVAGRIDRKGWQWESYRPLVRAALNARLPVVAANLSRGAARDVAERGFDRLDVSPATLALSSAWSNARESALVESIVEGHCGQLRPQDAGPMTRAQRARDAIFADTLLRYTANGAVLIAGAGHVRRDLAVPLYVHARASGASVVAVALTEIQAGDDDVAAYETVAAAGSTEPAFDFLWFTTRAERGDPCAGFALPKGATRSAPPADPTLPAAARQ